MGKRLNGKRGGVTGGDGINTPFAVVATLMAAIPGVVDVTVIGVAGPVQLALTGAPAQATAMLS
jgi:hypothetical protein